MVLPRDCCGNGLLEVKCPFKYRDTDPKLVREKDFCLQPGPGGALHLSKTHAYHYQVQRRLAMAERSHCDFVCWSPQGVFCWRSSRASWLLCVSKTQARFLLCEVYSSGTASKKAHYRRNACAFDNGRTILIHTVVLFLSAGRIWEHDTVWQSRVAIWLVPLLLCRNRTGSRGELVLSRLHEAWLCLKLWMFMCICLCT